MREGVGIRVRVSQDSRFSTYVSARVCVCVCDVRVCVCDGERVCVCAKNVYMCADPAARALATMSVYVCV